MRLDIKLEHSGKLSPRARQVCGLFDLPADQSQKPLSWVGDVPIDQRDWSVGLIVGPSGCGKSTVARELFGDAVDRPLKWTSASVVDDFDKTIPLDTITKALSSVGFNTIPAWIRPFHLLSNGEQFRVTMARRLLESEGVIAVDEFTSVVDRQVAKIGSHAIQKFVRRAERQFVAVSCHYDVIDWLQPDWVLEPATMSFAWRSVQPRPSLDIELRRCSYDLWPVFAPYHYLTAHLAKAARCFGAFVNGRPVAFCGTMHFPHPKVQDIQKISRVVTLPDWQGLGIAFVLIDELGRAYKGIGKRLRNYPAHPAFVRSHERSPNWRRVKEAGTFQQRSKTADTSVVKTRPCGTYEWQGDALSYPDARRFLGVA